MKERYLDLENVNHLIPQSKGGGIYDNRLWRESYYFNVTDPKLGISIITTIGMLPNKKRSVGFLLLLKNGNPFFLEPLISLKRPSFTGYEFRIGKLSYSVEGTDWRLRFESRRLGLNLRFSPINRIYPYRNDLDEEWIFERIATQHYEQFGSYKGTVRFDGKEFNIGPCLGHRDHSWGIRDWASVDRYSLHCCAFSRDLAFNLWEGSIHGKTFSKGFLFDGEDNVNIVDHDIRTEYKTDGREPEASHIRFKDSRNRRYKVKCISIASVPFPPPGSLVYEGIGKMMINGSEGYGLQEYLYQYPWKLRKLPFFLDLLRIKGGAI